VVECDVTLGTVAIVLYSSLLIGDFFSQNACIVTTAWDYNTHLSRENISLKVGYSEIYPDLDLN
jgi:hypothetical protein